MKSIIVLVILFSAALVSSSANKDFASVSIGISGIDPFERVPAANAFENNDTQLMNGDFEAPLNHFLPTDGRRIRLVCKKNRLIQ